CGTAVRPRPAAGGSRAARPADGSQAVTWTTWPTDAAQDPCCWTCCSMPCSRPCSLAAVGFEVALEALADVAELAAADGLLLTPRSVINLSNVLCRLVTLALLAAFDRPLDVLLLFRALMSDSSLPCISPWPR